MAINPLSGAGPAGIAGTGSPQKIGEDFGKVMKAQHAPTARTENASIPVKNAPTEAKSVQQAQPGKCKVEGAKQAEPGKQVTATKVLDQVNQAQNRMEQILKMAESGKSFSPAELLSLQTHVYRASQELDLAGKVVEKATGGVKQVLQTQV
ncbi:MAG: ATP-dependent helicase HrpB [Archangium sp.]|nr:ATP-dependent helicase HrpB [Archangium sp.]